jgi:hypothetical protein
MLSLLVAVPCSVAAQATPPLEDLDGDGVPDGLEDGLLARFAPAWMISSQECDELPAEFLIQSVDPKVVARNGTIYGQVFRSPHKAGPGIFLEVHYYHLWARDCGAAGHDLDVEHVAALVSADGWHARPEQWNASDWYAAAHDETLCSANHGARAAVLNAEDKGPTVWISRGKHASFLLQSLCRGGCGGDSCTAMKPFVPTRLVNIGEITRPLNGASWVKSNRWPLSSKMNPAFTPEILGRLADPATTGVVPLNGSLAPMKAVVMAGGRSAGGIGHGKEETEEAVTASRNEAGKAADTGLKQAGRSLARATRAVGRFLGVGKVTKDPEPDPPR